MKRKMTSFFIILVMLIASVIPVHAVSSSELESSNLILEDNLSNNSNYAILTNQYGESYYVETENAAVSFCSPNLYTGEIGISIATEINTDSIIPTSTTNHNYREAWDSTGSIKANTTVYFKTQGSPVTYCVTKVTGGFAFADLNVSVTQQKVIIGCNGSFPTNVQNQKLTYYPTDTSFSYNTGFTKYVNPNYGEIGASYTLTLQRHGSPWTFVFSNNLT